MPRAGHYVTPCERTERTRAPFILTSCDSGLSGPGKVFKPYKPVSVWYASQKHNQHDNDVYICSKKTHSPSLSCLVAASGRGHRGVVGYHVCLTRTRSPVRSRTVTLFFWELFYLFLCGIPLPSALMCNTASIILATRRHH